MITHRNITALGHINRYNGWTRRPYSVLEHTMIGCMVIANDTYFRIGTVMESDFARDVTRGFLIHDLEESVFGDIIRPTKRRYMTDDYFRDVDDWHNDLYEWLQWRPTAAAIEKVKRIDDVMICAEINSVTFGIHDNTHIFNPDDFTHAMADFLIRQKRATMHWWSEFMFTWDKLFPNVDIKHVR